MKNKMTNNMKAKIFFEAFACLFAALLLVTARPAGAELRYTAKVFDLDSHRTKLLYNYRSDADPGPVEGTIIVNNHFTYPDGKPATHEEITFTNDGKVTSYKQEQTQLNATGSIEFNDGKAKFTWNRNGKEKTATEEAGPEFIVGSQIPLQIEAHWAELMKGETMKRRLAVLERLETVGFSFSKEGEGTSDGKKAVIIKMKASSFIIAAIVSPVHFYMSEDGKALYEIKGRTTVKKDVNGKMSDLDADVVYTKGDGSGTVKTNAGTTPENNGPTKSQPAGGNSK
jgi:hypothetical protein